MKCDLTIVVEIEKYCQQQSKGDGQEDLASAEIPKANQPWSIGSGKKCLTGRQGRDRDIFHVAVVNESGKEDDGKRSAIVLDEFPQVSRKQLGVTHYAASKGESEDQQADHDREIGRCGSVHSPLPRQDLDAFL